ncbi:MAG: ABC transporter substrate-binding protein [Actinobacteria bacterium HGW-Actinobacteria-10]|jgi:branched-chain amino acid transport system substrate-binding protein|nr:MAG: ABC transporter substrate-binding protein [Actinobacteria bacterium HGW-Actinobacteria-10]
MLQRTRTSLALLLVAALLVALLAACSDKGEGNEQSATEENKEPYKIGAVLSETGTYAGLGEPERNTLEMEVALINDEGGVDGHPIEIVYADDATDPDTAVAETTRLIDKEGVLAIIGATGTGSTMAMRQEILRAQIPQVSPAGGTVITADFNEWVFQTPWSNALVIPYLLEYVKAQGITKVGLISESGGFGKDGAGVIKEQVAQAGMSVVSDQSFNVGDSDMTAQLTKIKSEGAQAVLMVTAGKEASIVAKNMADLAMEIPLFGTHGNARREFIEGAGASADGFRFPAGKILLPEAYGEGSEPYDVATDFINRYTGEYGKAPDTFAGHAYDALHITVNAMKTLDEGFTPTDLRDAIEKTNGFVGIGGTFTYSPTDHNGMSQDDLIMYEVKDGGWVLAE